MVLTEDTYYEYELKILCKEFNHEYGHIRGLKEVLEHFICLWDENLWESLFKVHQNWKNSLSEGNDSRRRHVPESLVQIQAIKNGIRPGMIFNEYSVDYDAFRNLYIFFEKLHSLYLGQNLVQDDLWALYRSDLAERVMGGLDQFDVFKGTLFLNDEFFQIIKQLTWEDMAKLFFERIHNLFISFLFGDLGNAELDFQLELKKVAVLLAHSSAVWSDSYNINHSHVLRAYKTLFKIIATDITFLLNKKYYTGYLVCEMCKETYNLHEHEAPSDFSHCSCGGELKYVSLI